MLAQTYTNVELLDILDEIEGSKLQIMRKNQSHYPGLEGSQAEHGFQMGFTAIVGELLSRLRNKTYGPK